MRNPEELAKSLTNSERRTEEALERAVEEGTIQEVDIDPARIDAAADATLRKSERLNLRVMKSTKIGLRERAAKEGLGYQTLASSVLHKYVTGRLQEVED